MFGRGATAAALIVALSGGAAQTAAADAADPACLDRTEAAFLVLINDYRADNGLPALRLSGALNRAADRHSADMAANDYFSHTGQDGSSSRDRMTEQGYPRNTSTGENIAAGYPTAQRVFNGWRNSAGHNRNMLNPNYRVIGIGLAVDESSRYDEYWTTDFGGVVDAPPVC